MYLVDENKIACDECLKQFKDDREKYAYRIRFQAIKQGWIHGTTNPSKDYCSTACRKKATQRKRSANQKIKESLTPSQP
jgi:hypothetical protein